MTSYSVERPTRQRPAGSRVRPGLVHLRAGEATTGQPVTVRTTDAAGNEQEFPAVFVRSDGMRLRCAPVDGGDTVRYLPHEVFPRREMYRRWVVTLKNKNIAPDGDGNELLPVFVTARTELEARYTALAQIRAKHGERSNWNFTLHSVKREG